MPPSLVLTLRSRVYNRPVLLRLCIWLTWGLPFNDCETKTCAFRMTLGESKDDLHLVEQVHFISTLSISSTILVYLFQQPLKNVFTSTQRCPLRTHNGLQPGQQTWLLFIAINETSKNPPLLSCTRSPPISTNQVPWSPMDSPHCLPINSKYFLIYNPNTDRNNARNKSNK